MGYPTKKLKDICEILLGGTPSRNNKSYWGGDNSWCSIADMKTKIISNTKYTITDEGVKNSNVKLLKKGTLFMSFKLSIGKLAFAGKNLYTNEAIAGLPIKNNNELNNNFLYYILSGYNFNISGSDNSVKGATLNKAKLEKLSIPLPPLPTQKLIVQKLDSSFEKIDKSIELTKKNLENIEELNKSVLEDFGDFKKVLIGDIVEKLFAGGDLPKDKSYSKEKTKEHQIPIYANAIKEDGLYGYTHTAKVFDEAITVSARGTIGFTKLRLEPFYPIVRLLVLIPKKELADLKYLEYILNTINLKQFGSSIPQLSVPQLKSFKIPLPPLEKQKEIVLHLDQVFEKNRVLKEKYENKLKDLEEMKQSLLKEAFEGRLVKE